MENTTQNKIYEMFHKSVLQGSSIKEHPLEKADERFKSTYYDLMYITAQYENSDTENQIQFIKRLMDSTNAVTVISDHIRSSGELNSEKVADFIKNCLHMKLEIIFFMDCLLIACSTGKLNKKQVDYLSEVAAALEIKRNEVELLCEYAIAILEQSTEKYEKANKRDTSELYKHILCYTKKFVCGAIANTDRCLHFYSLTHEALEPKRILIISDSASYNSCDIIRETIVFENLKIDLTNMTQIHDFHIGFDCAREVIFKSCEFVNGGSLRFKGCRSISIDDCTFLNFNNDAVFDLNPDSELTVSKSVFKNCGYETGFTSTTGGIIRSTNLNRVVFRECSFENCFAQGNFKGGIISFNNNAEAYECTFSGCNNGTYLFYSNNGSFKGDRNKLIDSVELKS